MKKMITLSLLPFALFVNADWRMDKFDSNSDGGVTIEELRAHCVVRDALYKHADKNDDGVLSKKELRKGSSVVLGRCRRAEREVLRG